MSLDRNGVPVITGFYPTAGSLRPGDEVTQIDSHVFGAPVRVKSAIATAAGQVEVTLDADTIAVPRGTEIVLTPPF